MFANGSPCLSKKRYNLLFSDPNCIRFAIYDYLKFNIPIIRFEYRKFNGVYVGLYYHNEVKFECKKISGITIDTITQKKPSFLMAFFCSPN